MKRLLIRADDLGYCEGINYGIAKTVKEGIIRSVGVMVNMPATEHGLRLIDDTPGLCLGQHTNICAGKPLTDPALIPSITKPSGEFKTSKEYREAKEDFVELEEVILEIEAQYQRFVELTKREPDYFEGHAVKSDNYFKGLEIVAARHNLKYCPFSLGDHPVLIGKTKAYMTMESMRTGYDPFQSLKNIVFHTNNDSCDIFVCHPGYLDAYILRTSSLTIPRTLEVEMACNEETREWLKTQSVELITYHNL